MRVPALVLATSLAAFASACPPATEARCNSDADCEDGQRCADGACKQAPQSQCPTFFADGDGDGHGDPDKPQALCAAIAGFVVSSDDCDDGDASIHPGAPEIANDGVDQDCDGADDCFVDDDGDGHGTSATRPGPSLDCAEGRGESGVSDVDDDCDDGDATIHPGAPEIAGDGVDQDCDGSDACFADADGDGFGAGDTPGILADDGCAGPGESSVGGDCDDGDGAIHPGAPEVAVDGVDQDCDGVDDCFVDADGDGHGTSATAPGASLDCAQDRGQTGVSDVSDDCDDADPTTHPGATEVPGDGKDEDCDGAETCFVDVDHDGFGSSLTTSLPVADGCEVPGIATAADDCDDGNAAIHPGAAEVPADGVDQDCDGVDACFVDADHDGHGTSATTPGPSLDCAAGLGASGVSNVDDDCDDGRAEVHPGALEVPGDGLDEDCDGSELCFVDADGDGLGSTAAADPVSSPALDCAAPGVADNDDDCDDTVAGAAGQACSDGQDCTAVDVCAPHGVCAGFDDGACGCGNDCSSCGGGCCDTRCNGGPCTCAGCRCHLDVGGNFSNAASCTGAVSCDVSGNNNGSVNATCDDSPCRYSTSSGGSSVVSCTGGSECVFDGARANGGYTVTCDGSRCGGDVTAFGGADVTCTGGAACAFQCNSSVGQCSASADASSTLVITCNSLFGCSVTCPGGTKTSCGGNVFVCNQACP